MDVKGILYPVFHNDTWIKIRDVTIHENFPLFCP
ncbi:MAG: cysteine-rich KTR domain-containing protein [Lachnospiraceae bacterium]|nr:cysteine-rich KTR domain-containing protein [Lachnospiraceae bacterium]